MEVVEGSDVLEEVQAGNSVEQAEAGLQEEVEIDLETPLKQVLACSEAAAAAALHQLEASR